MSAPLADVTLAKDLCLFFILVRAVFMKCLMLLGRSYVSTSLVVAFLCCVVYVRYS